MLRRSSLLLNISEEDVLMGKQERDEMYGFYLPEKCYVGVYEVG